ncbi:hypothetical protein Gohar_009339 [Gossypium harknessii]|uniref:Uncharacterized protein n=1 Tax=Gossypium harknessii TaxID=34285 RepID=A0A7J9GMJ8_9ROSI|nr:hypothetical protein [Gossypium harknessii]
MQSMDFIIIEGTYRQASVIAVWTRS